MSGVFSFLNSRAYISCDLTDGGGDGGLRRVLGPHLLAPGDLGADDLALRLDVVAVGKVLQAVLVAAVHFLELW